MIISKPMEATQEARSDRGGELLTCKVVPGVASLAKGNFAVIT
jgi:hypothetical protein